MVVVDKSYSGVRDEFCKGILTGGHCQEVRIVKVDELHGLMGIPEETVSGLGLFINPVKSTSYLLSGVNTSLENSVIELLLLDDILYSVNTDLIPILKSRLMYRRRVIMKKDSLYSKSNT